MKLYDALHKSTLDFIPRSYFRESTYPTEFTNDLNLILFLKKRGHMKFKFFLSIIDYREFSLLRVKLKHETKKCYQSYIERTKKLFKPSTMISGNSLGTADLIMVFKRKLPITNLLLQMNRKLPIYSMTIFPLFTLLNIWF
jgi:hypothetical protein